MNANKMACIHYESFVNLWIECLVFVSESMAETALEAVRKGAEMYEEEDNQEPYGECIEIALREADIPYLIEYCKYDEETDIPYDYWTEHVEEVKNCPDLRVFTVQS